MASDTSEGRVDLGGLGQHPKRTDPSFSPQNFGHASPLKMLRTYDLLTVQQESDGHWSVRLGQGAGIGKSSGSSAACAVGPIEAFQIAMLGRVS